MGGANDRNADEEVEKGDWCCGILRHCRCCRAMSWRERDTRCWIIVIGGVGYEMEALMNGRAITSINLSR